MVVGLLVPPPFRSTTSCTNSNHSAESNLIAAYHKHNVKFRLLLDMAKTTI